MGVVAPAAAVLSVGTPAIAQDAQDVSEAALIAESTIVQPGQQLLLGLHFELAEGWHIYWDGFNDTGFPPMVEWSLPDGVRVGPMVWPVPERYISPGGILDHVYEGRPTILVPVTIDASIPEGTSLQIGGEVEWLVCNDVCLPGFGPVSIELSVGPQATDADSEATLDRSSPIGRAAARLPQPVKAVDDVPGLHLQWSNDVATIRVDGAKALAFYPGAGSSSLVSALEDATADGEVLSLRLASPEMDLSTRAERRLQGVLKVVNDRGERWYLLDHGKDGLRTPEQTETISRVRDRLERSPS